MILVAEKMDATCVVASLFLTLLLVHHTAGKHGHMFILNYSVFIKGIS